MAREKMKTCAFITSSTLKDGKTPGLPDRCKAKGCTGKFKIDEDPKCREFTNKEEVEARAKARRKMRKQARVPRKHFKR